MNTEIAIIWYNHEIVGFWFGSKLIWNKKFEEVKGGSLKKTVLLLPIIEAIKFGLVFISGMSATRLTILAIILQKQIDELKKMEIKTNFSTSESVCDGDCNNCNIYEKCEDEITQITNAEFVTKENPDEDKDEEGWN